MSDPLRDEFGNYKWSTLVTRFLAAEESIALNNAERLQSAAIMSGDLEFDVSPATPGTDIALFNSTVKRTVTITLQSSAGVVITNFTGTLPISIEESTGGTGTAALTGTITEIAFVAGVAVAYIEYTGVWAATDTATLTIGDTSSVSGVAVANATCVDTFVGVITTSPVPTALGSSAAAVNTAIGGDGFTRSVVITLVDEGAATVPYTGTIPVAVAVSTAGDGDATIPAATVAMVAGVGTVVITYTGTWAEADTCTLTVGDTTTLSGTDIDVDIANTTSVDTLIA